MTTDRNVRVAVIGGTLRENTTSLGRLVVEVAQKGRTDAGSRRPEPVGAVA